MLVCDDELMPTADGHVGSDPARVEEGVAVAAEHVGAVDEERGGGGGICGRERVSHV